MNYNGVMKHRFKVSYHSFQRKNTDIKQNHLKTYPHKNLRIATPFITAKT